MIERIVARARSREEGAAMTTSTPEPAPTPAPRRLPPAPRKPSAAPDAAEPYIQNPGPVWKMAQVLVRVTSSVWFDLKVFGVDNVPRTGEPR